MRSVSYVQRVALEFSGSLFPHAICLGDVDNDTLNELVVGDTSGKLSVYKNDDSRPWLTCSCQGMLTCVGVGDVCNKGKNLVVAVSAEGWFHLCDLTPAKSLDGSGHHETLGGEEQRPVFKQHIPANTKMVMAVVSWWWATQTELSGLSAGKTWVKAPSTRWGSWCCSRSGCWRVRWAAEAGTADQGWGGAPSSRGLGAEAQAGRRENRPVTETRRSSLPVRVLGETAGNRQTGKATVLSQGCDGGCGVSWWVVPVDSAFPLLLSLKAKDVSQGSYPPVPASAGSRFSPQPPVSPHPLVQVDSLSVTPGPLGVPELMVSQPGCAYAILLCTWNKDPGATPTSEGPMEGTREPLAARDVVLHQTSGRIHNKNVSTHLIGNIKRGHSPDSSASGLFALCTLDGTLKLMEEADRLLWSVQVDHQLFALEKLDVTGNGHEEVVACAWDGQTYIIDHNRTVVRFQVDENIRAFCAGLYACKDSRNSPCLVYVTFNQKIYVYWEVQLERMESTNLLKVLEAQPEFRELLGELGVDPDELPAARALLHQTLYHPNQPPQCSPAGPQDPT